MEFDILHADAEHAVIIDIAFTHGFGGFVLERLVGGRASVFEDGLTGSEDGKDIAVWVADDGLDDGHMGGGVWVGESGCLVCLGSPVQ